MFRKAADLFGSATLSIGDRRQSFDDYLGQLSATTGMPITYCRSNADKISRVMADMESIPAGTTGPSLQTCGLDSIGTRR